MIVDPRTPCLYEAHEKRSHWLHRQALDPMPFSPISSGCSALRLKAVYLDYSDECIIEEVAMFESNLYILFDISSCRLELLALLLIRKE